MEETCGVGEGVGRGQRERLQRLRSTVRASAVAALLVHTLRRRVDSGAHVGSRVTAVACRTRTRGERTWLPPKTSQPRYDAKSGIMRRCCEMGRTPHTAPPHVNGATS